MPQLKNKGHRQLKKYCSKIRQSTFAGKRMQINRI